MTTATAPELVTEEMINEAIRVYRADERIDTCMGRILRAVAPMIAERASALPWRDEIVRRDEREACAKIAEDMGRAWEADGIGDDGAAEAIAAAIRARGETPTAPTPALALLAAALEAIIAMETDHAGR